MNTIYRKTSLLFGRHCGYGLKIQRANSQSTGGNRRLTPMSRPVDHNPEDSELKMGPLLDMSLKNVLDASILIGVGLLLTYINIRPEEELKTKKDWTKVSAEPPKKVRKFAIIKYKSRPEGGTGSYTAQFID